jgi:hypothetical protein
VFVRYYGQDFGTLSGAQMSIANFEATRRENDTVIKVQYLDEKPLSEIQSGGRVVKQYIGIDLIKDL